MAGIFRDNLLAGKVAYVTGGSSGIGQRMAERLAAQGAKVMIQGRDQAKLDAAVSQIHDAGGKAAGVAADVRDYDATETALAQCKEVFGPIDILIAGAAGNFPAPALGMSSNGFKAVMDIDLLGTFNVCRAAHQFLNKPGASIIAISAGQAQAPMAFQAHVCAAKAGVEMLVKSLALEWGREGIRLNCITPGPTDDTEGMRRLAPSEEHRAKVLRSVPLGRMGTRDELADLALFLSTEAAGYITGSIFHCDGGTSISGRGLAI